jgi:hypothetical protein
MHLLERLELHHLLHHQFKDTQVESVDLAHQITRAEEEEERQPLEPQESRRLAVMVEQVQTLFPFGPLQLQRA